MKKGENCHCLRELSMKIYLVSKQITVLLTCLYMLSNLYIREKDRSLLQKKDFSSFVNLKLNYFKSNGIFLEITICFQAWLFPLTSKNPLAWFCFTNVITPQATLTLCQLDDWIIMILNFSHLRESIINKNKR